MKLNLQLFEEELAKCDPEGILKYVRQVVEGKEPPSQPSPFTGKENALVVREPDRLVKLGSSQNRLAHSWELR